MAQPRRWFNSSLPQTLQIAVFLLYMNAALLLVSILTSGESIRYAKPLFQLLLFGTLAGDVAGANGIANENKWGYKIAVVMAFLPFVIRLIFSRNPFGTDVISLMFEVALVALLLHPQSRDYQRVWFK